MVKKKQNLSAEELLEEALVTESEWLYLVPKNWVWVKLKSISSLLNGDRGVNYPSKSDFVKEGIAFINAGALLNGGIDHERISYITEAKYNMLKAGKVKKNDILYCLRGTLGKNAILTEDIQGAIASSLCIIRTICDINYKYLYYLVNSEVIIIQQHLMNNGTAQPNLSADSVKNYAIPLPPLEEQSRIVDLIESHFEKLDQAKGIIQDVLDSFDNRKAAILSEAFSGELTKNWREQNGIGMQSWQEKRLGNLLNPMVTKKPNKSDEYFRYIDIDSIDNKVQQVKDPKKVLVSEAPSRASRKVETGDILFSTVRPYLKNIAYIFEDLSDCIASTGFYVCRCKDTIDSKYLYYNLCNQETIDYLNSFMKGDNSPSIRKEDFEGLTINLPTIAEQKVIIDLLIEIMGKEQTAKDLYDLIDDIDLMKKSILARAFRGELGTNDPEEKSAMELLKRMLSESVGGSK